MPRRVWIAFCTLVVALLAVLVVVVQVQGRWEARLFLAGFFAVFGLVLGYLTYRAANADGSKPVRYAVAVLLGYHALAAPVFLVYWIAVDVGRNDDLPLRLYPHVVAFVNSFE